MRRLAPLFAAAALLCTCAGSLAAVTPQPGETDPRIRIVRYDPNQVIELQGVLGYQISVEFGEAEHIENISIGDSLGWQVTPNRRANLVFLKPLREEAVTNMAVFTNLRRYMFDLRVGPRPRGSGARNLIFGLRFDYPAPAAVAVAGGTDPATPPPPRVANDAYTYDGSPNVVPRRVFDDGHATYFLFAEAGDYPAIFALDADKHEEIVNVAQRNGFVVVDQIARGFVLRHGSDVTTIVNDGFRETGPGPLSPKPRRTSDNFLDRLFP